MENNSAKIGAKLESSLDFARWEQAVRREAARLNLLAPLNLNAACPVAHQQKWRNLKSAIYQSLGESVASWYDENGPDERASAYDAVEALRVVWAVLSADEQRTESTRLEKMLWTASGREMRAFLTDVFKGVERLPGIYVPAAGEFFDSKCCGIIFLTDYIS